MNVLLIGCKNFDFFTPSLLAQFEFVVIASKSQDLPQWLTETSRLVRVEDIYHSESKTMRLDSSQAIHALHELGDIDASTRAFCNQEANLEVADLIRKEFGLYDHLGGNTMLFRQKPLMKEAISSAGLRAPRYRVLPRRPTKEDYQNLVSAIGPRLIAKPCASVGSRGVHKIFNRLNFDDFVALSNNDDCVYEVEEFIDGALFQFDFAIQDNVILARGVSRYSCPMADLQEGKTLASIMISPRDFTYQRIVKFGMDCARALSVSNGCFHMELFLSHSDELVFLEIAARSPGLLTVPAYESWLGVNFYDIELLLQLGQDASALSLSNPGEARKPAFFAVFPKRTGTILELAQPTLRGQYKLAWRVRVGDSVMATTTNIDYAGLIYVTSDTEEDAIADFNYLTPEFVPVRYVA